MDLGTDEKVTPARNGVFSSSQRLFPLKPNSRISVDEQEIKARFTYRKVSPDTAPEKAKEDEGALPKLTPPTPGSKSYVYKRWRAVDMVGSNHKNFRRMQENGDKTEVQFGRDNKCYFYKNGIPEMALDFILAPDGKSLLLSSPNRSDSKPMQILSLTPTQLIIRSPLFENNAVIFKAN